MIFSNSSMTSGGFRDFPRKFFAQEIFRSKAFSLRQLLSKPVSQTPQEVSAKEGKCEGEKIEIIF
jgi:hypothetical protein